MTRGLHPLLSLVAYCTPTFEQMQPAVQACCELPTSPALATTPRFLLHQFLLGAAPSACFGGCHVTTPCIDSSHSSVFGSFSRQTAAAISAFPVKSSRSSAVPGGGDDSRAGTETHEFAVNFAGELGS